jgi:multicomponent Na+:H+ antiporter subunit E
MSMKPLPPTLPPRGQRIPLLRPFTLALVMAAVWLLWSGHFTFPLLSFGAASCFLVVCISHAMRIDDVEGVPLLGIRPFMYALWLVRQIIESNLDVSRRILTPSLPIRPTVIRIKSLQRTDLGRVILANSITLTPGTVSIELRGDKITVHALTPATADFDDMAEMNRRVTAVERS